MAGAADTEALKNGTLVCSLGFKEHLMGFIPINIKLVDAGYPEKRFKKIMDKHCLISFEKEM